MGKEFPGMRRERRLICSLLLAAAGSVAAQDVPQLSAVEVRAQAENLEGLAMAGSEGVVSGQRLATVPLQRPGEVLEMVPGLIVTQHAGDGKANQYFLRGFNLDHGTDFATYVAGIPVNMPTHAHGQGYTDLNFLIPELVDRIRYRKGPYFADEGDFSSVGVARIDYLRKIDGTLAKITAGQNGYGRALLAGSPEVGAGNLLYAVELFTNDGPWEIPENYRKYNGVLRYSQGNRDDGFSLTGMAYRGDWTSTDQVAKRAIDGGFINRFGTLDPTTGGETYRYSLSGDWARRGTDSQSLANVWWLKSGLDLWSNFQYCLNDFAANGNCDTGDQFKQAERRQAGGFSGITRHFRPLGRIRRREFVWHPRSYRPDTPGRPLQHGQPHCLEHRARRPRHATQSLALGAERNALVILVPDRRRSPRRGLRLHGQRQSARQFRKGQRPDADAEVLDDLRAVAKIRVLPELRSGLPFERRARYHDQGDPADGVTPVNRVQPLVRTTGYEAGLRSEPLAGWQTTLALWQLQSDSELLFVGDAGTTEASRPSRRYGVEWNNLYLPTSWLAFDADLAWSHAQFTDGDPVGKYIPGAVQTTANVGLTIDQLGPWFGALRWRYFGPRPLVEDNTVRSASSSLTNLRVGYRLSPRTQVSIDVFNLFDNDVNDIEYWYDSQLPNETAPVFDRHIHPAEPRTIRLTFAHRF